MQRGTILLEKVAFLNKVYGCPIVCERGAFVDMYHYAYFRREQNF